ncbi:MAG: phosphomevalonate kinase [Senegalia sp. (in: firmicutes)]|uniref:phosphomevalonate kinase n=1 Tax=Senegalia sp. (in: firmicutes) TaxID=1924098 RepID=UPI003F9E1C48
MTQSSLTVKAPGKLMIAGEYSVLAPNQKSVVIAVNRYITINIELNQKNIISIPKMNLENITWQIKDEDIEFNVWDKRLEFIKNAISTSIKFLRENLVGIKSFKLQVESELEDPLTNKKYGLGSSGAIIVSVVSAILLLHNNDKKLPSLDEIFKLSVIAHLKVQKNGSGADIAAATYGGWIEYSAFDTDFLLNELNIGGKLKKIIYKPWPNLIIKKLMPPTSLKLAIAWTKNPAKTGPMVNKFQEFRNKNPKAYDEFLNESSICVKRLINSFNTNNYEKIIESIRQNRNALQNLDYNAKMSIETNKLRNLCNIAEKFGSGKSSGAGGGDCGIAFIRLEEQRYELYKLWEAADMMPLDLKVSKMGVSIWKF